MSREEEKKLVPQLGLLVSFLKRHCHSNGKFEIRVDWKHYLVVTVGGLRGKPFTASETVFLCTESSKQYVIMAKILV